MLHSSCLNLLASSYSLLATYLWLLGNSKALDAHFGHLQIDENGFPCNELPLITGHIGHFEPEVNLIRGLLRNSPAEDTIVRLLINNKMPGAIGIL